MSTIIDKLSDYYRNMADNFEPETDFSSHILHIFNMTEADLARVGSGALFVDNGTTVLEDTEGQIIANLTAVSPQVRDKD